MSVYLSSLLRVVSPSLSGWDATALVFHSWFLNSGFICLPSESADSLALVVADDGSVSQTILPTGWNTGASYIFRYTHPKNSEVAIRLEMKQSGDKLAVNIQESSPNERHEKNCSVSVEQKLSVDSPETQRQQVENIAHDVCHPTLDRVTKSSDSKDRELSSSAPAPSQLTPDPSRSTPDPSRPTPDPAFPSREGRRGERDPRSDLDPFHSYDPLRDYREQVPPPLFRPDGNLVGPNHPGFGPVDPFSTRIPPPGHPRNFPARFDPIDPLLGRGEPDPDHDVPPGQGRFGFPPGSFM